jgi:hypothetical protein
MIVRVSSLLIVISSFLLVKHASQNPGCCRCGPWKRVDVASLHRTGKLDK